jgi:hypothetical protein
MSPGSRISHMQELLGELVVAILVAVISALILRSF